MDNKHFFQRKISYGNKNAVYSLLLNICRHTSITEIKTVEKPVADSDLELRRLGLGGGGGGAERRC